MTKFTEHFVNLIKRISIIRLDGTDLINLHLTDMDSPFPELDKAEPGMYPPCLRQECRRGYAETWLSNVGFGGCKAEVVTYNQLQAIVIP